MPLYKALPVVLILGLIVLTGVFYFMEDYRPPAVERLFLKAAGYGPADSPNDALDKFKKAIRARNYKAAATFCSGEYAEELRRVSKRATDLGNATEDLLHNIKDVAGLNAPTAEMALKNFYPFPNDFDVMDIKHKEGSDEATAWLIIGEKKPIDLSTALSLVDIAYRSAQKYNIDKRICWAVTPRPWDGSVILKLEGDKQKSWKILMPVSSDLRASMQFLRDYGGNYVRALEHIKYSVKHDSATKEGVETELRKELDQAKPDAGH